jgi:hypothetical protein
MEQLEQAKVEQWRKSQGLEEDLDFRLCFTSYGEALQTAGRAVANAWASCQGMAVEESKVVAPLFAAETTAVPKGPRVVLKPKQVAKALQTRQVVQQSSSSGWGAADYQQSADALIKIIRQARLHRSTADPELADQSFRRIAEQVLKSSEKLTIVRALHTWNELQAFLRSKQLPAGAASAVVLDAFIRSSTGPSRALTSMK